MIKLLEKAGERSDAKLELIDLADYENLKTMLTQLVSWSTALRTVRDSASTQAR